MDMMQRDEEWMRVALEQARYASELGEVPVGGVLVRDGVQIAVAHNLRQTRCMATAHAEILAIEEGCRQLGGRRLSDCTLYVTLEPCPMCAGALVSARIGRIVFGAKDARAGACGSMINLFAYPLEAKPDMTEGILEEECLALLRGFFEKKRNKNEKKESV